MADEKMTTQSDIEASDLLAASGKTPEVIERRKSTQRRAKFDRRRKVKRNVGMEISPQGITLAVIERKDEASSRQLITHYEPFPEDSGPLRGDWTDPALAETISKLVAKYQLAGNAVTVGLGGSACMTRVMMGENEDVDNDVRELTERARRYMGMGRGEKVCCHTEQRLDAKRKRVWVTVAKRSAVDAVASAVANAGLRLGRLEHTMVVLCRVLNAHRIDQDEPVLLVSDQSGRLELGISYQGRLLLDYRPAISNSDESEDVVLRRHIKCLRRYLQAKMSQSTAVLSKVFVSGGTAVQMLDNEQLQSSEDLQLRSFPFDSLLDGLSSTIDQVDESPGGIAAIWLARDEQPGATNHVTNDLMSTLRPSGRTPWLQLLKTTWPVSAAALLACVLSVFGRLEERAADRIQQQVDVLSPDHVEAARLRFVLQEHIQFDQQTNKLARQLPSPHWTRIVFKSGSLMPDGMWLESVRIDHRSIINISGASFTDEAIYEYINQLKSSGLFARVSLDSTNAIRVESGPAFRFEITAEAVKTKVPAAESQNVASASGREHIHG
ncbi:MAG: PilN domain-containing protein [Pirellulaceae bacterium]